MAAGALKLNGDDVGAAAGATAAVVPKPPKAGFAAAGCPNIPPVAAGVVVEEPNRFVDGVAVVVEPKPPKILDCCGCVVPPNTLFK